MGEGAPFRKRSVREACTKRHHDCQSCQFVETSPIQSVTYGRNLAPDTRLFSQVALQTITQFLQSTELRAALLAGRVDLLAQPGARGFDIGKDR